MGMKRLALLLGALGLSLFTMTAAKTPPAKTESIVLGGGCFWCTDAAYKLLPGVVHVTCGYAGGPMPHPTYEQVCEHITGHAEVVKIDFDPAVVSLDAVLNHFWVVHDPTQVGGQGGDMGPPYRSIVAKVGALVGRARQLVRPIGAPAGRRAERRDQPALFVKP